MSENEMPDRSDDDVAARLGALHPSAGRAPQGGAAAARSRARHRQVARTGGLAVVVAALVTAVPLYLAGEPTAAPPATPTVEASTPEPSAPAPSPPEPSTPEPSLSSPEPSGPVPSVLPSGGVESPAPEPTPDVTELEIAATTSEPAAAGVLVDFDLSGRDTSGEGASGGGATWTFDPCTPTAWPSDRQRTGWWAWNTYLGDSGTDYAVAVYDTEERAADALSGFTRAAEACLAAPGDPACTAIWQTYPSSGGVTGAFRVYSPPTEDELIEIRRATWVGAVRQGRVVALVQVYDHFGGGLAALAQGDTRPGTGASYYGGTTQEEAGARLAENLSAARADAARLAEEASQHVGGN